MSAARWADRATDGADDAEPSERPVLVDGPFDATDLDLEQTDAVGRLDFESLRVPMPDGARLQIEKLPDGRLKAVHVMVECGRLSVSALAAPKNGRLWPELADEVARSLQKDGARVRVEPGVWGREVVAWAGEAQSRFVGVDGQRWMLYGISTGPSTHADEAADILRDMIRGTIVVRGSKPYPVRTVLPLSLPAHLIPLLERLEANAGQAQDVDQPAAEPSGAPVRPRAAGSAPPVGARPVVPAARRADLPGDDRRPAAAGYATPAAAGYATPAAAGYATPAAAGYATPAARTARYTPAGLASPPTAPAAQPAAAASAPPGYPSPPSPVRPPAPGRVVPTPPAAPPTTAFEPPLTTMLPTPPLPPAEPSHNGADDPWLRTDDEPLTPLNPFTPPAWPVPSTADAGSALSWPDDALPEPLPPPGAPWTEPMTARPADQDADPGPAQESAWLSMQQPDFVEDTGSGRHRAPERESGRHRRR